MKRITIRIPIWIYEILKNMIEKRGISLNAFINQICFEFIKNNKGEGE